MTYRIRLMNNTFEYNSDIKSVDIRDSTILQMKTSKNTMQISYGYTCCVKSEYQSVISQMELIDKIIELENENKLLREKLYSLEERGKH